MPEQIQTIERTEPPRATACQTSESGSWQASPRCILRCGKRALRLGGGYAWVRRSDNEEEKDSGSDEEAGERSHDKPGQEDRAPFSWSQLAKEGEAAFGPVPTRQLERAGGGDRIQAATFGGRYTDQDRLPGSRRIARRKALGVRTKNRLDAGMSRGLAWMVVFVLESGRGLVTATRPKQIKRFYEEVSIQEVGGLFRVLLDGKVVKTPKGTTLDLPGVGVAHRVAREWRAQGENLEPLEMPFTTLGCTALDITQKDPEGCIDRMMPFLEMDTVCFQVDEEFLAERQQQEWGPLREWFQQEYAVKLGVATGLGSPGHPEDTMLRVAEQLLTRDAWELCALEIATQTAKSLIVASALLDRSTSAEEAMRWAQLEENFQIERWGLVEGDHDVTESEMLKWFGACRQFGKVHRHASEHSE
eukprot:s3228_g7.t1